MTDYAKLEEALVIDENELELALKAQPNAYNEVSKAMVIALSQRDAAKKALEETEAEVDLKHRHNAANNNRKVAEGEFRALLALHKDVKAAKETHLKADAKYRRLQALKESFEQRSWAINKMVDLYIHNYYGASTHHTADDTLKNYNARRAKEPVEGSRGKFPSWRAELRRERQ